MQSKKKRKEDATGERKKDIDIYKDIVKGGKECEKKQERD